MHIIYVKNHKTLMKDIQRDRRIIFIDRRLYKKNTYKILSNITQRLNENTRKIFKTRLVQKTIKVTQEGKRLRIVKRTFFLFCVCVCVRK